MEFSQNMAGREIHMDIRLKKIMIIFFFFFQKIFMSLPNLKKLIYFHGIFTEHG